MRIVVDTNVIVSGIYFGGLPRKVLELWREEAFKLICSPEIMEEYEDVLKRLEIKTGRTPSVLVPQFMNLLLRNSTIIQSNHNIKVSRDPEDDKFVNCALSGKALYIVSGDSDLLDLGEVEGIQIITAKDFVEKMSI